MSAAAGYTLLEMVVVVSLLGLATAMVAPAGYRMIGSWREATRVNDVAKALAALPATARAQGRQLRMLPPADATGTRVFAPDRARQDQSADTDLIALPEGWSIRFTEPLVVGANGACSDARGTLVTERQRVDFTIDAPFCHVRLLPAGES